MSGVFLSYSRGDRALAAQVTAGLRRLGVEVWWDEDMPGVDWQLELERQINDLAAVLVLWTPLSVSSMNVRDEARLGQQINKLVNGLAGVPAPPFPFDRFNGLPLDGLTDRAPHAGWTRLVQTLEDQLVKAGSAKPGDITGALARHEEAVQARQAAVSEAEAAFQSAKADEDAEAASGEAAAAALRDAEEQLGRVVAMRGSQSVLRAAQADLETAQAAKAEADRARKAAGATLAAASRNLSAATRALESFFDSHAVAAPAAATKAPPAPPTRAPRGSDRVGLPPAARASLARGARAWASIGVAGAIAAVAAGWLLTSHRPTAAASAGRAPAPAAQTVSSGVRAADASSQMLTGEWSGNGATCANPLAIIVKGKSVSAVVGGAAQTGVIRSASADGLVSVDWPDGAWTYKVSGDTLTMTPSNGQPMAYQRCAG